MPEITVSINPSFQVLAKRFDSIKVGEFLRGKIQKLAFLIEREAKQVTPVDTGRLRASIRVIPMLQKLRAVIGPHTEYATYVHEGTRYMRARPFMMWGTEKAVPGFDREMTKDLDLLIQRKIK